MSIALAHSNIQPFATAVHSTLLQQYIKTIHHIRNTILLPTADEHQLKMLQEGLSPWASMDQMNDPLYKDYSQSIYQFHTAARWYFKYQHQDEWKLWRQSLQHGDIQQWLELPCRTNFPQFLKASDTDVAWVHHSPFHAAPIAKTLRTPLQKLGIRLEQPIRMITPALYSSSIEMQNAVHDMFPGVQAQEINKLAFWSMIGQESTMEERQYMLKQKPRYLGGPSGSSLWLLHGATPGTQASSKARTAMLEWMIQLTEHMVDLRDRKSELIWSPQHTTLLYMYERALHAVLSTASTHKRSLDQINELHSLSARATGQLVLRGAPQELVQQLQYTQDHIHDMLSDKPTNIFKRRTKIDILQLDQFSM